MAASLSALFYLFVILIYTGVIRGEDAVKNNKKNETVFFPLEPNKSVKKLNPEFFQIYCFDNIPKSFLQIWRSVHLLLEHAPLSYEIFTGENASIVQNKYEGNSIWSASSWLPGQNQKTVIDFPAFTHYCIGLSTKDDYVLFLKVRVVNYWKVLQTIVGVLLFLSAPSLSRNSFFHYTFAASFGVLASFLILIYICSRFIPQKSASYAIIVFGYSFILYMLQVMWQNFNNIISNYMDFMLIYCLCAAFISFLVCYRLGPIQNERTFNIIKWFMQIAGVILIYFSSEYREVSTALIIILMTIKAIPKSWISYCQHLWYRFFPPKIKLLTELEYMEQANIETKKALEELRKYCRSPDCNTWKVVQRLNDPIRFSRFIDTGNHYTDEELLRYNSEEFDDDDNNIENEAEISYRSNGCSTSSQNHWTSI